MMRITKTTKLDLCLPDLEDIINEYLLLKMDFSNGYDTSFRWKVVNKSREGSDIHDSVDGVEITVTEE
jgi:hypothetical protein